MYVLAGMGTGDESRYFGAKSDRDCALQSMLQGVTVAFRWPMMIGFAVLGLFLINELFPNQDRTEETTNIIHEYYPDIEPGFWHDLTAKIVNDPEACVPAMVRQIQGVLGEDWQRKLPVISYNGTVNPEQILPAVMLNRIPLGLRGFLLVAMLAAMMST